MKKVKYYLFSDNKMNKNAKIIVALSDEIVGNTRTCRCGFSYKGKTIKDMKKESYQRMNSNLCIIMCGRSIEEDDVNIAQAAWVVAGKDCYDKTFILPDEIKNLDIQYHGVAEKI